MPTLEAEKQTKKSVSENGEERTFFPEYFQALCVPPSLSICFVMFFMPSKKLFSLSLSCAQRTRRSSRQTRASATNKERRSGLCPHLSGLDSRLRGGSVSWERPRAPCFCSCTLSGRGRRNQVEWPFFISLVFPSAQNKDLTSGPTSAELGCGSRCFFLS